ncbi:hypothetical protein AOY35_08685 [Enterococcus faecium]|nr:hypothetical protein AOY35_08685 [Enterococcus faecium]
MVIPRDRNGKFSQQTLPAYKRTNDSFEKMYGHHYTPQTISNMTKIVSEDIIAFKERSLESRYSVIFMDATHIPLKRQTVSKEAVYIVIGIRLDGTKEVLGFSLAPTESAYVWKEILQDLKDRGLKEVLLVVTDGLSGINDSIHSVYPFPPSIRRTIYSTNLIEGFNKQLKKYTKRKEQFPNEESLERFLVSQFNNYNQKFLCRVHKGFKEIHDTLESMF